MELHILYQCPSCSQKVTHSLADFAPGQKRDCADCGTRVTLTDESLAGLRQLLHDACRH